MPDLSRHYDKAEKLIQKGKLDAALETYEDALEEDPRDERAREGAAELCLSMNDNARAAELLDSLLRDYVRGLNASKAVPTFKKLLRLGRPLLDVVMEYGEMMESYNRRDAIEAYETGVKQFQGERDLERAMAAMAHIVILDPRPENFRRQAEIASSAGEHEFAAKAYIRYAQDLEKANFDPFEAYAKAFQEDSKNVSARLGYGRALVTQNPAEAAVLLEHLATAPSASFEAREPYANALIALGRSLDAEPFVWELFEHDPQRHGPALGETIGALLDCGRTDRGLALARKFDEFQRRAGKRREFVQLMRDVAEKRTVDTTFLEYMAELYDGSNREADYCATLGSLFDLYFASGNYIKAYDSLERAVEVDSYEAAHHARLARLRGRIEQPRLDAIASRLGIAGGAAVPETTSRLVPAEEDFAPTPADETTVLEDLVLQAEIFLQYSMRTKALEKIQRIHKLFPREELSNSRVRDLYANAGFVARYADPAPLPKVSEAATTPAPVLGPGAPDTVAWEDLARAAEVNRNIARQANVKSVLFAAVNDVGRNWNASRCMAGLCSPGKPPSAVVEYCAPGVKQCDVPSIVKLVMGTQPICAAKGGAVGFNTTQNQPELQPMAEVLHAQGIASLLGIPMLDGDQQVGIMVMMQSAGRVWRQSEVSVLRTIADQMVLAINNARLRSLVKTLAVTDERSGLLKRSSYIDVLLSEVRRAAQQNSPLTLVLLQFGKPSLARELGEAGVENMMQQAGQLIASHIRQNDVALRYSDTQVALLLSDTDGKNSTMAVEKLRRVLMGVRIPEREKPPTVRAGIAEIIPTPEYDVEDVVTEAINRVEQALSLARTAAKSGVLALPPMAVTIVT